jgi:hypothetical protein
MLLIMEGLRAKVQYAEVSDKSVAGQVISVELSKWQNPPQVFFSRASSVRKFVVTVYIRNLLDFPLRRFHCRS